MQLAFFSCRISKFIHLGKKFQWQSCYQVHRGLTDIFRLSDILANWLFCWLDILRVQLKSNWTVGKRLLASDSKTVWKSRLILPKALLILVWKLIHFERITIEGGSGWCHVALRELLRHSDGLPSWSFCWLDISRVQLKSNLTVGNGLLASDSKTFWKSKLILSKSLLFFMVGLEIYSFGKN